MSGRKTNLMIALEDKPGQLSLVSDIVSACGANVVSVHHDGSDANMGTVARHTNDNEKHIINRFGIIIDKRS